MIIECQKHPSPLSPICMAMIFVFALVTHTMLSNKMFGTTPSGSELLLKHIVQARLWKQQRCQEKNSDTVKKQC